MATALTSVGIIAMVCPIVAAAKPHKFTGLQLAAGMSIRAFQDSGSLVFTAFVSEVDNVSGASELKALSCATADVSWTDIYTVPAGKKAYAMLVIANIGGTPGTYSFGIAGATEVVGEGGGA